MIYYFLTNKFLCDKDGKNTNFSEKYKITFEDFEIFRNDNCLSETLNDGIFHLIKGLLNPDINTRISIKSLKEENSSAETKNIDLYKGREWLMQYMDSIRFYYILHENDYIKFLLELQKLDQTPFMQERFDEEKFFSLKDFEISIKNGDEEEEEIFMF